MNFQDFQRDALKTESRPDSFMCNTQLVLFIMGIGVEMTKLADSVKKAAFYGKPIDQDEFNNTIYRIANGLKFLCEESEAGLILVEKDYDPGIEVAEGKGHKREGMSASDIQHELNIRLAHSFLGVFTESGELMEALLHSLANGEPIDRKNIGEEFADIDWYKAIGFDELGLSEEETRTAVIAKLKKRYGDKFNAEGAINRDVAAERQILEREIDKSGGSA